MSVPINVPKNVPKPLTPKASSHENVELWFVPEQLSRHTQSNCKFEEPSMFLFDKCTSVMLSNLVSCQR